MVEEELEEEEEVQRIEEEKGTVVVTMTPTEESRTPPPPVPARREENGNGEVRQHHVLQNKLSVGSETGSARARLGVLTLLRASDRWWVHCPLQEIAFTLVFYVVQYIILYAN